MQRTTEPVKRVCYADDLTGWATGVMIPDLEDSINSYMSSVDHLHVEAEMLKVKEHSELLSAQYLTRCLEPGNVCHSITTRETPKRRMKKTLFARHRNTVEPMMFAPIRAE